MTSEVYEKELLETAKEAAGNWKKFECFVWWREDEIEDPENWTIHYTHNRDSGLLDQSNAEQIAKALEKFTEGDDPDVVMESHNHWAVGHVDGFSMRVFRDEQVTEAFKVLYEIMEHLDNYPVLDDEDYSRREHESTMENIESAAWSLKDDYELPENWVGEVYSWFWDNDQSEVDNVDDQGGYPSKDGLRTAFEALGYKCIE